MFSRVLVVAILAARVLPAQAPPTDSSTLLDRARVKLNGVAQRLPKYTCIETIDRAYYAAPMEKRTKGAAPAGPSCSGSAFNAYRTLKLDATDRLRIQVAVAGGMEIHSWATASHFDERSLFQLIQSGPVESGTFGSFLGDIFENPGAQIKFEGQVTHGKRELYKYSFRVPLDASHYHVRVGPGWKVTAYTGSFELYPATAELARLVDETDQLTPDAPMCRAKTSIDYHYVLIGDGQFLLPRTSVMETVTADGNQTRSQTTFSSCREYSAESTIRFDDGEDPTNSVQGKSEPAPVLLPGVSLTLALIDFDVLEV